jgi:hypothetical protein
MTGVEDYDFPLFNRVAAELRAQGHVVFNPAEADVEGNVSPSETAIGALTGRKSSVEAFVGFWILLMKSQCSPDGKIRKAHVLKATAEAISLPVRYLKQKKSNVSIPIVYQFSGYIVYRQFVLWVHRPGASRWN